MKRHSHVRIHRWGENGHTAEDHYFNSLDQALIFARNLQEPYIKVYNEHGILIYDSSSIENETYA
jgi:hypothetical protein